MLRSYFKIAWRNILKSRIFSFINIFGLAIGLACFLLIALYVLDETSYDRFHAKADNIYRINSDLRFGGGDLHMPFTSDMMGQLLKQDYPQVEQYTRIYLPSGTRLIRKGNGYINEHRFAHVDSTFFEVFSFPALAGDTRAGLNDPNTIIITESTARKYFGTADVVGKTIQTREDKDVPYRVTAVIKDMPANSHFHFDFLFSMKNADYPWGQLTSHNFHTYLLLRKGTDYRAFEKNFDQYIVKYVLPYARQFFKIESMEEFRKAGNKLEYSLIPLKDIHLYSERPYELTPSGNIRYVYIFSAVAIFILLIACVNFMNLTTARSANRAKEVGIRKVLGTGRKQLIGQFLTESILMAFLSLLLAIGMTRLALPAFNELANKSLTFQNIFSNYSLGLLILLPLAVGLLAGSYPAFYLSGFRPIQVIKGVLSQGRKASPLRSILVVFQFSTSIVLIIGTLIIYLQLKYIQSRDLGYNKDQVLIINDAFALGPNDEAFKEKVLRLSGVQTGTLSSYLPVSNSSRSDNSYSKDAVMDSRNSLDMQTWQIDYDYLKTMGMEIVRGRNFSKEFGSDSTSMLINETTAKFLQYDDPIGKKLYTLGDARKPISYTIVGVVRNFNFESLRQTVGPLCFVLQKNNGLASFKVNTANITALVSQVEDAWKQMAPGMPLSYRFLDDSFEEMYRTEQRIGKIAMIFSVLAVLVACLGLFGLATFVAEQRTKEIGIRKVLGASVQGIVGLVSRDFVRLVAIAFLIAAPLAWFFMDRWLRDFAYRINMSWWIFGLAGAMALLIALLTISFQAIRAALANPVRSLRSE